MSEHRTVTPEELRLWLEETKRDTVWNPAVEPPEEEVRFEPEVDVKITPRETPPPPLKKRSVTPPLIIGETHQMDKRLAQRFTRGELSLDATLDLHGANQEQAHEAVIAFVLQQAGRNARHLCIVTGKGNRGGGVLRASIERWLNTPAIRGYLLSAITGKPHKGGEGAVYVLLKRHERTRNS